MERYAFPELVEQHQAVIAKLEADLARAEEWKKEIRAEFRKQKKSLAAMNGRPSRHQDRKN